MLQNVQSKNSNNHKQNIPQMEFLIKIDNVSGKAHYATNTVLTMMVHVIFVLLSTLLLSNHP